MSKPILLIAGAVTILLSGQPALARDHAAGAVVGAAVAPKHHRLAGAIVGGAVQHHMAKTKAKKQANSAG